jgi:pSer/pThr/pTyr-binding forkhead associated (FHA) protein
MKKQKEFELAIMTGKQEGEVLSFDQENVSIGRDKNSDCFVDDPHSSKSNCFVVFENDQYFVVDNNSTNGTFLNERKIEKEPLKNGDEIKIGESVLQFRCEEEVEESAEADMTMILPRKGAAAEEVTVILSSEPPKQEEETPDPNATVLQPVEAPPVDPNATVLQPLGAPVDPNATQIAPIPSAEGKPKAKKKKKGASGGPFSKLDKAARLRIMIASLAIIVLMIFGAALLMPSGKPRTTGSGNAGGKQNTDTLSGNDTASKSALASMSSEAKIQKAEQMFQLGKTRYEERFLKPGSMYEAIQYFEKADMYLEDVSPKPASFEEMQQMKLKSIETLQNQFNGLRMEAYRLGQKKKYSEARAKLEAMLKLVPNPDDERHKLAQKKLKEIRNK